MPLFNMDGINDKFVRAALPPRFASSDLSSHKAVIDILNQLAPEELCDAIYADWVVQLGRNLQQNMGIKQHVIQGGALNAEYLAELVQNADDAISDDNRKGSFHAFVEKDWLVVSNNGRKFTGGDVFGLCRFFSSGKALTPDVIGKFGIGFKACYQMCSEVYVRTWDHAGSFTFRLPIPRAGLPCSYANDERLGKIIQSLKNRDSGIPLTTK